MNKLPATTKAWLDALTAAAEKDKHRETQMQEEATRAALAEREKREAAAAAERAELAKVRKRLHRKPTGLQPASSSIKHLLEDAITGLKKRGLAPGTAARLAREDFQAKGLLVKRQADTNPDPDYQHGPRDKFRKR